MRLTEINSEELIFNSGQRITYEHRQECGEYVYADFEHLKTYNILPHTGEKITIFDIEFDEDLEKQIERIEELGFNLIAKDGSKWLVPCHNEQNGYYSSNLALKIQDGTKKPIILDISELTKFDKI